MNSSIIITTGIRSSNQLEERALELSQEIHLPYYQRKKYSLQALREMTGAAAILMVSPKRLSLVIDDQELFFHPGLAKLRIKEIQAGKTDQMIKAMDLQEGNSLLDCTLGLAADALVASYVVGPRGTIVGLEDAKPVAEIVSRGLCTYTGEKPELINAMRRIKVMNEHHLQYLCKLPSNAFDVVYFDPMFRVPKTKSSSMAPLRFFANSNPLSNEAIVEAVRVARKKVVMKESRESQEFQRLNFHKVQGGRYSPVAYGVIQKDVF
ncbi:class I SAM-dependent methyltransferase [Desulfotomaculum sp. 1211_IL3151]|uniref:class I SAM-dependent methyltransferase n=1 Tax=Desulfotomaculum sp. 1211_IL3151 TaxID=3084055 RepID=UPI002FDA75A5